MGYRTIAVIAVCTVLAGAASFAMLAYVRYTEDHPDDTNGAFGTYAGAMVVSQVVGQLGVVSVFAMITEAANSSARPGMLYALYLSAFDVGDVISLILSTQFAYAIVGRTAYNTEIILLPGELSRLIQAAGYVKMGSVVLVFILIFREWINGRLVRPSSASGHQHGWSRGNIYA